MKRPVLPRSVDPGRTAKGSSAPWRSTQPGHFPARSPSSPDLLLQRRALGHSIVPVKRSRPSEAIQRAIWPVKKQNILDLSGRIPDVLVAKMVKTLGLQLISAGNLFYDSDLTKSRAVPDAKTGTVKVYIPSYQYWYHSADVELDFDAAAIHELTHAAEVMKKVERGNYQKLSAVDLMDNPRSNVESKNAVEEMLNMLDEEAKLYKSVPFQSITSKDGKTLFGYLEERLLYAYRALDSDDSNYEVVTVVNQIMHAMDVLLQRSHPEIQQSEFYIRVNNEATAFDRSRDG